MAGEREHGYARYRLDGCRCYVCGYARAQYDDNRNRAIAYGAWKPWVDAEPVRVHIRHLQSCGMGLRTIAAAASVDRKRLQGVVTGRPERGTGPQEQVRPALAAAVLAVEPTWENLAPSTLISPVGTRRRLYALVAVGWPQQILAVRLGMTPGNFGTMLSCEHVLVRRALAVCACMTSCGGLIRRSTERAWLGSPGPGSGRMRIAGRHLARGTTTRSTPRLRFRTGREGVARRRATRRTMR